MLGLKELRTKIGQIITYSEDLKVFKLRLPENNGFSFVPGQFVMVSLPNLVDKKGRRIAKAYSIASSSSEKDFVELCIAKYPQGALSPVIYNANIGDEAIITGPYGVFNLKEPVAPGTVFIAGGTGLAPIMSMLRSLYAEGCKEKLWLFYSISEPRLFMFKEELLGYERNNSLTLVVSTSNPDSEWKWESGRVTDTFLKLTDKLQSPKELQQFYLCGPPVMVTDTIKMLEQLGFKKENIHKEQW